ncbi:helix-turn-helix domain-containing protein [Pisciglobus halotolerans]|uniref:Ribulose-phosphate 3-epimerase n=1 Tax=Pisciglobus halotolerans TaxID=745365 RepID=A0A1I3CGY9_9LACT|nr:helix-turn-helix domain-containing protein [Pisciglobus halotolerans]SFH73830.1 ribulose-phosphate 3-epimerase [Pisciglobus halotolerans]
MKTLSYLDYFILSLLKDLPIKATSLFYILKGKRTASMLYKALETQLTPVFGLFPSLEKQQYDQAVQQYLLKNYVAYASSEKEDLILTQEGKEAVEAYFKTHYKPTALEHLKKGKLLMNFQKKSLFLIQVFSELRYHNRTYIPIERDYFLQLWVKQWLQKQNIERQELALAFGEEWGQLLDQLAMDSAQQIVLTMTGHTQVGQTRNQLAYQSKKESMEIELQILDSYYVFLLNIDKRPATFPLLYSIIQEEQSLYPYGLGKSVQLTKNYLEKGYALDEIASRRNLKNSTVSEHIIELAIICEQEQFLNNIPTSIYEKLNKILEKEKDLSFAQVKESFSELPFLWYRLVQIERLKKHV